MTRPLFQRPPALSVRVLGFGPGASYATRCVGRAPLGVKYAEDSEFEQGLHSGETGADYPGVRLKDGPDAEPDEIICGGDVSFINVGKRGVRAQVKSTESRWTAIVFKRSVAAMTTLEGAGQPARL